jgi:hypothetical protein
VENILMRLAERALARRASRRLETAGGRETGGGADLRAARTAAKTRIARRGPLYVALRATTWVMKLDLLLLGRIRSGPFFALLERD